ncbi:MAG: PqiC family protein [Verrucomicrobiaceae bacterium]
MPTKFLSLCLPFVLLLSCSTGRNYYVLSPVHNAPARHGIGIGVGPVSMADYLVERPYVIFQSTPHKMEISDMHEWAGDLRNDFTRVLSSNLGHHMGTGNLRIYPWERDLELRYQITVDVTRFHGTADGDAILEASWRAYELPGSRLITSQTTTLREPLADDGFESLVAAQSRLIDQLSKTISTNLKR